MAPPTTTKTPEEINNFLTINDIQFDDIDDNLGTKTQLFVLVTNFKILSMYLAQLLEYVKNLYLILDVSVIINSVIDALESTKPLILISSNHQINVETQQIFGSVNSKTYIINRLDQYTFKITKLNSPNWDTSKLIVQSKTLTNSEIIYPSIKTSGNAIYVTYHDAINEDYIILFI